MAVDFTGQTFGSYKLVGRVGRGGMATVYRGYQESIDRSVAVKVLPHEYTHDANFSERFLAEARVLAKLTHPSIMPLYDFGTANEVPYIVMPLMAHGTLSERLDKGPLAVPEVLRIATPIAAALDFAHKLGVVHRDLKPSNILFDQNDTPYLGDFGIAKAMEATSGLTGTGIIGTPEYMSPEQAQGEMIDGRSDIYALGVVVYQLLAGHQLFSATTPMGLVLKHITEAPPSLKQARPDLPEAADAVLRKALSKRPTDRYQTAGELVQALAAALGQSTLPATSLPATADMGTILKPMSPADLHRPIANAAPNVQGTFMPPPATTTAPPPTAPRAGGVLGILLGGGIGVVVGIIAVILLLFGCCVAAVAISNSAATPTPTVIPVNVLLDETFAANGNKWAEGPDEDDYAIVDREFTQGQYQWKITPKKGVFAWVRAPTEAVTDFDVSVEVQPISGSGSYYYGLTFRDDGKGNFYYFGISTEQKAYKVSASAGEGWDPLISWTDTTALLADKPNVLAVTGQGKHFSLYINGVLVGEFDDEQFTSGKAGVAVDVALDEGETVVAFDNFKLTEPIP